MPADKRESNDAVEDAEDPAKPHSPNSPNGSSTRMACCAVLQSWVSKKFMTGCLLMVSSAPYMRGLALTYLRDDGDEELCSVYVPTNHLYIGNIYLLNSEEIIRPNLSVREGIEIIVSVGMSMPQVISSTERIPRLNDRIPISRMS